MTVVASATRERAGLPAGEPETAWLATWLADWLADHQHPDSLYVVSSLGGAAAALEFWASAAARGPRFANPRLFPWALVNSPTGHLAERLGIRGPTFTFVGRSIDVAAEQADHDLRAGRCRCALVVALTTRPDGEEVSVLATVRLCLV